MYSRYSPLFIDDSLDLQRKFPNIYRHFMEGGFVCYLTDKQASGIGFDMGLEKEYNFDAKACGGIIGVTRQKKAVALWDLLKHSKDQQVVFMKEAASLQDEHESLASELNSLHHEFSERQVKKSQERVNMLINCMKGIGSPFSSSAPQKLHNIVAKEELSMFDVDRLMNTIKFGEEQYSKYTSERLKDKSVSLHATISHTYISKNPEIVKAAKKKRTPTLTSDDTENAKASRYIQYATSRGIELEYLLSYPLLSRPVFLLEKNQLFLKKSSKGELGRALLSCVDKDRIQVGEDGGFPAVKGGALVIDFMSVVRRIASVDLKKIKEFGGFGNLILTRCLKYGCNYDEIHLVLENYKDCSPKSCERMRRAHKIGNRCEVASDNQMLPENFDDFFSLTENKKSFLSYFVSYCKRHYSGSKVLYLAGGLKDDPSSCTKLSDGVATIARAYRASHEEADGRMMLSIHQIYLENGRSGSVAVLSPDTDVLVSLLFHIQNTWQGLELLLMRNGSAIKVSGKKQWEFFHLSDVIAHFGSSVINQLPAAHALTGCDTVAKIGTKAAMLRLLVQENDEPLTNFGRDRMDSDMLASAEKFLIQVLSKKYSACVNFNELRTKLFLHSKNKKLTELPCCSDEIRENIKRAELQTQTWLDSPFLDKAALTDPTDYGYTKENGPGLLIPTFSNLPKLPENVPQPCSGCKTCARITCPCRQAGVGCSDFCSCSEGIGCKNPHD